MFGTTDLGYLAVAFYMEGFQPFHVGGEWSTCSAEILGSGCGLFKLVDEAQFSSLTTNVGY